MKSMYETCMLKKKKKKKKDSRDKFCAIIIYMYGIRKENEIRL